ncbi:STAS domain-containing protein [Actinophytocola sp.]|uniref:STAS domain-containing protein n=1 Tax=Actinophytocola sp. TaxID=1872138 RepID=UPI00389ACFA3
MSQTNHVGNFVGSDLLWIDRTVDGHAVVVRVFGEVDLVTAPLLSAQLRLAEAVVVPPAAVVLDLTGVTFIGSAGLTVLLDHRERCAVRGTRLQVIGGHLVRRVVTVAGLAQVLPLIPAPRDSSTVDGDRERRVCDASPVCRPV